MQENLIGKSLGQFEIIEEVGRGGMATVYRARQTSIKRTVAIKVLPRTLLHDPSFYERFTREVDVIAHLEHPHILPIYDYGEVDGTPYIAMRYLAGGSMAQWLRRSLPPLDKLPKPMSQIASALDYAHQQGIIHRDLKPGNVLLDENGNAYLSDFGIARVLDSNLTGSAIIGTPAYMSPEQANGLPLDARSDIYSLGVVLFEMVTGRSPFEAETPVALLLKHINEPIPSVRGLRPEVPAAAERVIVKSTAKRPDDRYPSATDLADAFADAMHSTNVPEPLDDDPSQATLFDPDSLLKRTPATPMHTQKTTPLPIQMPPPLATPATRAHDQASSSSVASEYAPPSLTDIPSAPPPRRVISPVLIVALVLVVIAIVAAVVILPSLNPAPPPTAVAAVPTPFASAYTVQRTQYTLSVPDSWAFVDLSDDLGMTHVWQNGTQAYVGVRLIDKSRLTQSTSFTDVIEAFETAQIRPQTILTYLDTATAEDGTVRRSYRLEGENEPGFPPGQTDLFYQDRGDQLAVFETYSAYAAGNELVPVFQQVLDSLRVSQA